MRNKAIFLVAVLAVLVPLTIPGVRGQEGSSRPRAEENADRLRQVVQASAREHSAYCNQFLEAAISQYLNGGDTYAQEGNLRKSYSSVGLAGMDANAQIDFMEARWSRLDLHQAMRLASEGQLVVAGLKGQPGHHGHVAVVMPGGPDPRTGWPVVAGGGAAAARSIEGKSMTEVWRREYLAPRLQVEFFTPRFTTQVVTVDVNPAPGGQPKAEAKRFTYRDDAPKQVGFQNLTGTTWREEFTYRNGAKYAGTIHFLAGG